MIAECVSYLARSTGFATLLGEQLLDSVPPIRSNMQLWPIFTAQ